ncbi:hypothetical protein ACO1MY_13375, partial [Staphylococcus aureus]
VLVLITMLFFDVPHVISQTGQIDSLKLLLKASREDTNKVKTLNALSSNLLNIGQYDSARVIAQQVLSLASSLSVGKAKGWA